MKMRQVFLSCSFILCSWSLWTTLHELLCLDDVGSHLSSQIRLDDTARPAAASLKRKPLDNGNSKPLLIIHVGPPKTGTTTIQAYAGEHMDLLQQDNIYFLGEYRRKTQVDVHRLCFSCIMENELECASGWNELESVLQAHNTQGHHVLISDENFSRFGDLDDEYLWRYLLPILQEQRWRVRILFTYRRFYEWIPSWYYEYYNPNGARGKKKKRFLLWPDSIAKGIPSFSSYFDSFEQQGYEIVSSINKWRERFDDVRVLNMHGGGEYVHTFFCDLVPEANSICNHVRSEKSTDGKSKNLSASKDLHHDMLAVGAHLNGLIPATSRLDRTEVRKAVAKHAREKLGYTSLEQFPLECLSSQQLKTLLNLSRSLESKLVPDLYSSKDGKQQFDLGFQDYVEAKRFCSIDTNKALEDSNLRHFFASL